MLPLAGTALAAVTALDASPETANNQLPGDTTHSFTAEVTANDGDADDEDVQFAVISGPNADFDENGVNQADGTCTTADVDVNPATYDCTYESNGTPGTDTIRVFGDNNGNNQADAGEPQDDITKTWTGAPFTLTMTPESDSAAVGTCNAFTVTLTDQGGRPNEGAEIRIVRDHANEPAADDAALTFCDPDGAGPGIAPTEDEDTEGDDEGTASPTNASGQLTFGIMSTVTGTETVRAYYDTNGDDDFNAGEPTDTSTKTWTAGGDDAVATLDCEPENATNPTDTDHVVTCTATNSSGDPVNGVTVQFSETGPATPDSTTCTTGDTGAGECEATFTSSTAGDSTITAWVNQSGGGTAGPDAGEPQDTVNKTWTGAPETVDINLYCEDYAEVTAENCTNPAEAGQESVDFTAYVEDDETNEPVAGVRVDFVITGTSGNTTDDDATLSANQCTTGPSGDCSVTLTNPAPADGDSVTVEAEVAGEGSTDQSTKTWEDRAADDLDAYPNRAVNQIGDDHTVCATITDQFGDPVEDADVDFTVTGRNNSGIDGHNQDTDNDGEACFTYTDTGPAAIEGEDDILVTSNDTGDSETVEKRWIDEPAVAAEVAIDMNPGGVEVCCDDEFFFGSDCDADQNDLNGTTWEETATNSVDTGHLVCISAETAGGESLEGHEVDLTSQGVGHFFAPSDDDPGNTGCFEGVDVDNSRAGDEPSLGNSTTVTIEEDGYARICLYSNQVGTQTVTAEIDGATDTGVKSWMANPEQARVIDCEPETATNLPGTAHAITCTVTDQFGNVVPGVQVQAVENGPGDFTACTEANQADSHYGQIRATCDTTTDNNGQADYQITSAVEGTQTVEVAIEDDADTGDPTDRQGDPTDSNDECDAQATQDDEGDNLGTDPNAPAGVCFDEVTKTWSNVPPPGEVESGPCSGQLEGSRTPKPGGGEIIVGTPEDDALVGTTGDDTICGLGGNDVIDALDGADQVVGNAGNDTIDGGAGRDQLNGGAGDDSISGRGGNDVLNGRGGNDTLKGNSGRDTIRGGGGNDTLQGGNGVDTLNGGGGNDTIRGWTKDDVLKGGSGRDLLIGNAGADFLNGGGGRDTCRGGKGNDTFRSCERRSG